MGNIFNNDFRDFIFLLNKNEVEYILVGGYAVILHGYRRTTGDMDIWVNVTIENYKRLCKTFYQFGLAILDMTEDNFLYNKDIDVFTFGRQPVSIDIMKEVKGCSFNEAFKLANIYTEDKLDIRFVHLNTLKQAKLAAGRHKDLNDLENLF